MTDLAFKEPEYTEGTITYVGDVQSSGLPKWPAFTVWSSQRLTYDQTIQVLIRCTDWWLSSNDKRFLRDIYHGIGIPTTNDRYFDFDYTALEQFRRRWNILELQYCDNHQIASCYIGGPHGWLDWNGRIGCSGFNVGKWPSVTELAEDWGKIAAAFPFLSLTSTVWSGEQCENNPEPVATFVVSEGLVRVTKDAVIAQEPTDDVVDAFVAKLISNSFYERGISVADFKKAWERFKELNPPLLEAPEENDN